MAMMTNCLGISRAAAGLRAAGHFLADGFVVFGFLGELPDGEVLFAKNLGAERILYTNNNVSDAEFNAVVKLADESGGKIWINCDSLQRLEDLPKNSTC